MTGEDTSPEILAGLERLRCSIAQAVGSETARAGFEPGHLAEVSLDRALARLNHQEAGRQANIEQIIRLAVPELPASDEESLMDRAWLLQFFRFAQDAGQEEEQQIWAYILVGEAVAPGSFGKRTLAFLSAMESWELERFIAYTAFAFAFESGWRFLFETASARREIWAYEREGDLSRHFVKIGLLEEEIGRIDPATALGLRIRYRDRLYELRSADESETVAVTSAGYRKFTVIGQQLADAVRPRTYPGYARNLLKALADEHGIRFEPTDA